jgi:hypothetical protein
VSQRIFNDALFNIIMSAALQLGFWNTTVPVNITNIQEVYSFVSPPDAHNPVPDMSPLIEPLPWSGAEFTLRLNGVFRNRRRLPPDPDDHTTGSKTLENVAAAGCLGGDENVPENLKRMRIRFGELVWNSRVDEDGDRGAVKRAGFGTDDEVLPLRSGIAYGA